jgi:hypothetical protein
MSYQSPELVYALPLKRQWCKLMGMPAMRTGTFAPV